MSEIATASRAIAFSTSRTSTTASAKASESIRLMSMPTIRNKEPIGFSSSSLWYLELNLSEAR